MPSKRSFLRALCVGFVGALALLGVTVALAGAAQAAATTRYVSPAGSDSENDCTVQASPCLTIGHAVQVANDGDTIHVAAGIYAESVVVDRSVIIEGVSPEATKVTGNHDGSPAFSIGNPEVRVAATLRHLSATQVSDSSGIVAENADVTLEDVAADNNAESGLIASAGTVDISGSHFDGNGDSTLLEFTGAGIALIGAQATVDTSTASGNGVVGIISLGINIIPVVRAVNAAPQIGTSVQNSTVAGNGGPGVASLLTPTAVDNSTIAGNSGAGVLTSGAPAEITRSTVTGTKVPPPGQIFAPGTGGIVVTPVTAPGVTAIRAEGLRLAEQSAPHARVRSLAVADPTLTVSSSIVAKQAGTADCDGPVTDGGYNLSSDAANSCTFSTANNDIVKTDPKLGALAANGGPTETEKPLKGSPAIDAVPSGKAGCAADATDQRGVERPQPTNGPCDIGAVELAAKPIVIHPGSLPHGTVGEAYHALITATGGAYPTYTFSLAPGSSLPDGLSLSGHGKITGTPSAAGTFHFTVSVNDPVLKQYTIVVENAGTNGAGQEPISATGTPVLSMTAVGAGTIFAGFLLMMWAGAIGRRPGRHREPS